MAPLGPGRVSSPNLSRAPPRYSSLRDNMIPGFISHVRRDDDDDGSCRLEVGAYVSHEGRISQGWMDVLKRDWERRLILADASTRRQIRYSHSEPFEAVRNALDSAFDHQDTAPEGAQAFTVTLEPPFLVTPTSALNFQDRATFTYEEAVRSIAGTPLATMLRSCASEVFRQQQTWVSVLLPDAFERCSVTTAEVMQEALDAVKELSTTYNYYGDCTPVFWIDRSTIERLGPRVCISVTAGGYTYPEFDKTVTFY